MGYRVYPIPASDNNIVYKPEHNYGKRKVKSSLWYPFLLVSEVSKAINRLTLAPFMMEHRQAAMSNQLMVPSENISYF
jgi:hypothetical protein